MPLHALVVGQRTVQNRPLKELSRVEKVKVKRLKPFQVEAGAVI